VEEKLVKQISELSKKSQLFDILIAVELSKLYIGDDTTIKIPCNVPNYERITNFFELNNIPFEKTLSKIKRTNRLSISFGYYVEFQDLFIISTILKIFGFTEVFLMKQFSNSDIIYIGCCPEEHEIGVSIEDLLAKPFYTKLVDFLNYFRSTFDLYPLPNDYYEEQTFYALTDSQYGDYDGVSNNDDDKDFQDWLKVQDRYKND
jgi:hypothetical protein